MAGGISELSDEIRAGDHTIALGRVMALERREEVAPLVFCASRYGTVAPSPEASAALPEAIVSVYDRASGH